ncbi:MAG: type 1 glutamine amidotransferase domain-containing protein [Minicystis sp.]
MLFRKRLKGKRIAALAADGFEQIELTIPVKALRAEGADVDVISVRHGKILGMNLHEPGRRVRVDRTLGEIDPASYDALFVPGGFINPDTLRQSREARVLVRRFDEEGKPIATLCHGPWLLASAEVVRGRQLTSWPGIRDDLVHAGATWRDEEVVRDKNWVSSRGPQDLRPFVKAMIDLFAQRAPAEAERPACSIPSAPQRTAPPFLVLAAAAIMPRPSLGRRLARAGAVLAAAGLAVFALRRAAA